MNDQTQTFPQSSFIMSKSKQTCPWRSCERRILRK